MGKILETVLDFILIILCAVSLLCIIGANNNAIAANNYIENAEAIISASNINPEVIEQCKHDATSKGYVLDAQIYNNDAYSSRYAVLKLKYSYEIPLLKVDTAHIKTKIAR